MMESAFFRVLWPLLGPKPTMNYTAGRKKYSAEDVVRKLRRADEFACSAARTRRCP
ncbi:hypothetical protein I547_6508 [Mycobacterium kansasii 824]|uniref:Uncharacterized protein n=1 Tax=Mycobacterium kansasii TaxID=1768 RepID=A0A1V3XDQ6_MYCKA|nr:hypothetical protein I547_6508 [Mycobacterium kansasii 824]OOK77353.1 hypothetical protein BZL29_3212 [Mycobacterium kansasii]